MTALPWNMAHRGDARRTVPASSGEVSVHEGFMSSPMMSGTAGAAAPALSGFTVELPLPPSSNHLFKSAGHRRARTGEYRKWALEAGWLLDGLSRHRVPGWYDLSVTVPIDMRGDNHNRFKAIADLLVAHKLIDDDRYEFSTFMMRSAVVPPGRCVVTVSPRSPAPSGVGCGPRPPLAVAPRQAGAEAP